MSRMIPSSALMTAIPRPDDRGAFMSITSSLQQIAGGVASVIAGWIIVQEPGGRLLHFDRVGYVSLVIMVLCAVLMWIINSRVEKELQPKNTVTVNAEENVAV